MYVVPSWEKHSFKPHKPTAQNTPTLPNSNRCDNNTSKPYVVPNSCRCDTQGTTRKPERETLASRSELVSSTTSKPQQTKKLFELTRRPGRVSRRVRMTGYGFVLRKFLFVLFTNSRTTEFIIDSSHRDRFINLISHIISRFDSIHKS